ncbi:hypothetical protein [Streptomyces sp. NPDC058718]|uniref:hypothetical protein n=1 Tax=Streptomyces sp. NPDC058718 TaxID=3346610 RepID=UPI00367D6875
MADRPAPVRLTGDVHPDDYFRFVERDEIDWEVWTDVLRGKVAGAAFRGVLAPDVCEQIRRNFWSSPVLERPAAGTSRNGHTCGAPLLGSKGLDQYLEAAEQVRAAVDDLFADTGDGAVPALLDIYREHLERQGVRLRLAEHRGRRAGTFKMRSRENSGPFQLAPHDDADPLRHAPHLDGFEVQRAEHICGAVACVENGPGGDLVVWNISPDLESRRALGFGYDSKGYPVESLDAFPKLTVPVGAGDIIVFDVSKVHAVGRKEQDGTYRSTIQWNMSFLDATTVLQWS